MVTKEKWPLIIGLGNPSKEYAQTYHNVGYLFIDYFLKKPDFKSLGYLAMKSTVFMNESGSFVNENLKKNKAQPAQLLIIHDDSDITIGNYKLSFSRGAAGHNGIISIIKAIKTDSFWRLRIGIRSKLEQTRKKAGGFVLNQIRPEDKKILAEVFRKISQEIFSLAN